MWFHHTHLHCSLVKQRLRGHHHTTGREGVRVIVLVTVADLLPVFVALAVRGDVRVAVGDDVPVRVIIGVLESVGERDRTLLGLAV
jgi:hypothetical protein